jgi:hypothetical protein
MSQIVLHCVLQRERYFDLLRLLAEAVHESRTCANVLLTSFARRARSVRPASSRNPAGRNLRDAANRPFVLQRVSYLVAAGLYQPIKTANSHVSHLMQILRINRTVPAVTLRNNARAGSDGDNMQLNCGR